MAAAKVPEEHLISEEVPSLTCLLTGELAVVRAGSQRAKLLWNIRFI